MSAVSCKFCNYHKHGISCVWYWTRWCRFKQYYYLQFFALDAASPCVMVDGLLSWGSFHFHWGWTTSHNSTQQQQEHRAILKYRDSVKNTQPLHLQVIQ